MKKNDVEMSEDQSFNHSEDTKENTKRIDQKKK